MTPSLQQFEGRFEPGRYVEPAVAEVHAFWGAAVPLEIRPLLEAAATRAL